MSELLPNLRTGAWRAGHGGEHLSRRHLHRALSAYSAECNIEHDEESAFQASKADNASVPLIDRTIARKGVFCADNCLVNSRPTFMIWSTSEILQVLT